MTGPSGLLNFFVLEATEYVDQLDGLLSAAGPSGPDAEAFTRAARALRGSATMAKMAGISGLAAAVERIGRALRERMLPWTPGLHGSLTGAVDDLRILVRGARSWGEPEEQRAHARTTELLGIAPPVPRTGSPTPIATSSGALFVVNGCTDVAASLTSAASRPGSPELLAEALRRLRGFRGVAALKDFHPIGAVLDAIERAARTGDVQPPLSPAALAVLSSGARYLRRLAEDIRAGRPPRGSSPEALAFAEALGGTEATASAQPRVIPVASLFHDDDGPHVIHAADLPGTSATQRFQLESAGLAEHVRRLVHEARAVGAAASVELTRALESLLELVRSFGHEELARRMDDLTAGLAAGDLLALTAADATAALLVQRRRAVPELAGRLDDLVGARAVGNVLSVGFAAIDPDAPNDGAIPVLVAGRRETVTPMDTTVPLPTSPDRDPSPAEEPVPETEPEPEQPDSPSPQPVRVPPDPYPSPLNPPETIPTAAATAATAATASAAPAGHTAGRRTPHPTGRDLQALLANGIAGIDSLDTEHDLATAAPGSPNTPPVVPVESLLYSGPAALARALELRDAVRRGGGPAPKETLEEIFDLIELAATS